MHPQRDPVPAQGGLHHQQLAANSSVNNTRGVVTSQDGKDFDKNEQKIKGLLGCYYTMVEKLFVISGGIFLSYALFLAQKPQGSTKGTWMGLLIGSFVATLSNFILLIHASYSKESGSIEDLDVKFVKWLHLLVLAFVYTVFCTLLRAFANTSDWISWLLGIIGLYSILHGWAWFFYRKLPKILVEMKKGHVVKEGDVV